MGASMLKHIEVKIDGSTSQLGQRECITADYDGLDWLRGPSILAGCRNRHVHKVRQYDLIL